MDIEKPQEIETEEETAAAVKFSLNDATGRIVAAGPEAAVDRALARIAPFRDEVAEALRERQGLPKPGEKIVTREVSTNVPSKAVQRANYKPWYLARGVYFTPKPEEEEAMWAQVNEGDLVHFDFAHSITVERPSGLLVAVDRKGRVTPPSTYAPALKK